MSLEVFFTRYLGERPNQRCLQKVSHDSVPQCQGRVGVVATSTTPSMEKAAAFDNLKWGKMSVTVS